MKVSGKSVLAMLAGLFIGWSARAIFTKNGDRLDTSGQAAPKNIKDISRPRIRPTASSSHDLSTVQACRDLLGNNVSHDPRHPLLVESDRSLALRRWLELDPKSALAEAEGDPTGEFAEDLFREWVELDPSGALAALNEANPSLVRAVALEFFVNLMAKDPAMAAAELQTAKWKTQGTDTLGWDFHRQIYQEWMRADPASAIAWLDQPESPNEGHGRFGIMEVWAEMDFKAAWEHFFPDTIPGMAFVDSTASTLISRGLLAGSPDALRILGKLSEDSKKDGRDVVDRQEYIADAMVEDDPEAALEWAKSRPADDLLRMRILANAASTFASSDPEQALALLKESGGSAHQWKDAGAIRDIFAALAVDDAAGTADRICDLPSNHQSDAISGYLTHVYLTDPVTAADQCRAWLENPDLKDAVPKGWAKAFSWGHGAGGRDPAEMLAAIPELNDAVDENVLSTWTKVDPEAAAGWISERLETGHEIPFGNEGILAELAISKPEFTASWLLTLQDQKIQKEAAGTLTANWGAFDPASARQWIDGLPDGEIREAAEAGMKRINEVR